MTGFKHDIAGGGGNLVIPALQSPNYQPGVSGWQISKSGNAEFNDTTVRGTIAGSVFEGTDFEISTSGLFFYSGTPAAGNLVMALANTAGTDAYGNPYKAGVTAIAGSAVTQLTNQPISNQTIPVINLATGIPSEQGISAQYADVVNPGAANTYIDYWIQGPSSTFDNRSAAIVLQSSAANGAGIAIGYLLYDGAVIAAWNAGGFTVRGADGNTYQTGRLTDSVSAAQEITSTSPEVIFSVNVGAGTYRVHYDLVWQAGSVADTKGATIGWNGSSVTSQVTGYRMQLAGGESPGGIAISQAGKLANQSIPFTAGQLWGSTFDGLVTFSEAGTFNVRGQEGTSGAPWTVQPGSFLDLMPVS